VQYVLGTCADDYHPFGREGVGVTQGSSGIDYPLVRPSEDIRYLLADLFLAYEEPADYTLSLSPWALPFHIQWLYGLGCPASSSSRDSSSSSSASSASASQWPAGIIIRDELGSIVFDSETATRLSVRDWGPRLRLFEWYADDAVCRIVIHTKWSPDNDPPPRDYPDAFAPQAAEIDARALYRIPRRVRSITALGVTIRQGSLQLRNGYNTELQTAPERFGFRQGSRVTVSAKPGSGEGQYPGCDPVEPVIRRISGQGVDSGGNFRLAAAGCYYARQPSEQLPGGQIRPWILRPEYSQPTPDLPGDELGWPASDRYAHFQIGNDCKPCLDCDAVIDVARYLNRLHDRYSRLGDINQENRDAYRSIMTRWNSYAACLRNNPLRILIQPQYCPFVDVGVQYCNHLGEAIPELNLTVSLSAQPDAAGTVVPGYGFISGGCGTGDRRGGRFMPSGSWPNYTVQWTDVPPRATVTARWRISLAGCPGDTTPEQPYVVTGTASVSVGSGSLAISAAVTDSDTLECPLEYTQPSGGCDP
jgi:hypothetical protein